ncbi:MAG: hypothetical protein ACJ8EK_00450, partial [Bradyrhizobium sp.]
MGYTAAKPGDLDRAFSDMKQARCDALYTLADPYRPEIPEFAAALQIPAIYQHGYYVENGGGLRSYGPYIVALIAHAADSLDKIFNGSTLAELPVEQPTKFEFDLNLKAAERLV